MGWVMFKQGQFEQAIDYLTRAYALQHDPEIAAHLVEVWLKLGSPEEARATLEAALEDFPEHPVLLPLKGRVLP
jgi:uncharacterized protein HemY